MMLLFHGCRPEWVFNVAGTSQAFPGEILEADREDFEVAVDWLAGSMPAPDTPQEFRALAFLLRDQALRAAALFHREYHRAFAPHSCLAIGVEFQEQSWAAPPDDPRVKLQLWKQEFLAAFDATHPWPAAVRVAAAIRRSAPAPFNLDESCKSVGMSRSSLNRAFQSQYGISMTEYHRRCVLRWAATELRAPASNVEATSLAAGFSSRTSFYSALGTRMGITPGAVKSMTHDQFNALMDGPLALPSAGRLGPPQAALPKN
jgi:AraC-like DNA-binding protein